MTTRDANDPAIDQTAPNSRASKNDSASDQSNQVMERMAEVYFYRTYPLYTAGAAKEAVKKAFVAGYDAHAERTKALVEAARHCKKIWMGHIECTDIFPLFDALAKWETGE